MAGEVAAKRRQEFSPGASEAVNELQGSTFPSLPRRGGRAIKKMVPFRTGADGVVNLKLCFGMRSERCHVNDHSLCFAMSRSRCRARAVALTLRARLRRCGGFATFYAA